ncbi:hypothetical protein HII36_32055 [Nonomuraea sp. NN258]|uniref:hypothetical protein n=1 Tax=Nonomuraea antri TaxID=2730852 RepID=UPI001568F0BF|nr:hypothetical protein [Nonomuraea antri]NRQ36433.1 hypothetical protein [Nonomuraea antri]
MTGQGGEADMADRGVALLLREVAEQVDPGMAPYQAVVRGGRRRKARRWAAGTVAALAAAGVAGTLVTTVLPARQEQTQIALPAQDQAQVQVRGPAQMSGQAPAQGTAQAPAQGTAQVPGQATGEATDQGTGQADPSPEARHVYAPQVTQLAEVPNGKATVRVSVEVWGAPRDESEIREQRARMKKHGVWDERSADPVKVGDVWFAVVATRASDGKREIVASALEQPGASDLGYSSYSLPRRLTDGRVIVGHVTSDVRGIAFVWRKEIRKPKLVQVAGLKERWFSMRAGSAERLRSIVTYDAANRSKVWPAS